MPIRGFTPYREQEAQEYLRMGWWRGITFGDLLDRAADMFPEREALVDDRSRLTYRQLRERANKLAVGLMELGINSGDRVLLQLPNWAEFVYAYFACQKIGAIVVLALHRHGQIEVDHLARLTEARAWIVADKYRKIDYLPLIDHVLTSNPQLEHVILVRARDKGRFSSLEQLAEDAALSERNMRKLAGRRPDPMEVAQMLPTGGTTGLPKAAPRTHNDYICSLEYKSYAWKRSYDDTCLVVAPAAHGASLQIGITSTLFSFGKLVLSQSPTPEDFCATVEREKVTCAQLVPALLQRIIEFDGLKDFDMTSLKKIHVGAAHSPRALLRSAMERLVVQVVSAYGSVEGTHCNTRLDDDPDTILTTVGRPCCPYDHLKVVDRKERELPPNREGELVSKGPSVFSGYFKSDNRPNFTKDGYFKTGDLAEIDEHGNVRITGRIKDIIVRGGENINPGAIEELIIQHPEVREVAVIGMPDRELGERICAYIQPAGDKNPTFDDIIFFLKKKGASVLLLPERVELVDAIPLTSANKPDKKTLREDIRRRIEREEAKGGGSGRD